VAGVPTAELARVEGLHVDGSAIVYRLYDVGYEIALDRALDLLAASAPERVRPVRGEAQALQIRNPPVTVILGHERVTLGGSAFPVEVSARLFDFGVVSLRARVELPPRLAWREFVALGSALDGEAALAGLFAQHLRLLRERVATAIERPALAEQSEDYIVYRVGRLTDAAGASVSPTRLGDADVVPLCSTRRARSRPTRGASSCRTASRTTRTTWRS
jgi:hypothetical protein